MTLEYLAYIFNHHVPRLSNKHMSLGFDLVGEQEWDLSVVSSSLAVLNH
jgi:hypothetical protein